MRLQDPGGWWGWYLASDPAVRYVYIIYYRDPPIEIFLSTGLFYMRCPFGLSAYNYSLNNSFANN